jgi:hypothetical protein
MFLDALLGLTDVVLIALGVAFVHFEDNVSQALSPLLSTFPAPDSPHKD